MATKKGTAVEKKDENAVDVNAIRETSQMERFSDDELQAINSHADAISKLAELYGEVVDVGETLGNGFAVLPAKDKTKLIGVPFVILNVSFNHGDYGDGGFASMAVVTGDDKRFIVNDGSSGIYEQLMRLASKTGRYGGFSVSQGLRASEYETCTNCGKPRPDAEFVCETCGDENNARGKGQTFYLDTSTAQ